MKNNFYKNFMLSCAIFVSSGFCEESSAFKDFHLLDVMRKEIPSTAQMGSVDVGNLNLNRQGNVIAVCPQEKVFAIVNISCNANEIDPHSLYQIVVGLEGIGAQKSILNEFGYRIREGIFSFFLEAPEAPGVYNVQFQLQQASSPLEAMQLFDEENSLAMTIGKIIVLEEQ